MAGMTVNQGTWICRWIVLYHRLLFSGTLNGVTVVLSTPTSRCCLTECSNFLDLGPSVDSDDYCKK